jgi:hypothetical protein
VQDVDLAEDVVPGGQGWHLDVPPEENWPAAHATAGMAGLGVAERVDLAGGVVGALPFVLSASNSRSSDSSDAASISTGGTSSSRSRSASPGEIKESSISRSASRALSNSESLKGIAAATANAKASSAMLKVNFMEMSTILRIT